MKMYSGNRDPLKIGGWNLFIDLYLAWFLNKLKK